MGGTLYVGTSGFAYPGWAPLFYPAGTRARDLLGAYAERLPACELNGTFYRQPSADQVRSWADTTPPDFRFSIKAQRGGAYRALHADPGATLSWLLGPFGELGPRLGSVLLRVPEGDTRDDERLGRLLAAWPPSVPLTVEFRDPSWEIDEVYSLLRARAAVLCATEHDGGPVPPLTMTGPFLYLRLRRLAYTAGQLADWAARIVPFLDDERDVFVFFRHDADGRSALAALDLADRVERRRRAPA